MHIAMWSGPRNLSTAMMYSFGARDDFDVVDEPFYGAYLRLTDAEHPMRDETLRSMETDPVCVVESFAVEGEKRLYTKQMTHHMVDGIPRDWFGEARHAFLIRHPARVVASYVAKRENPTLEDLGFLQQEQILNEVRALRQDPVVVDSFDIRRDPEGTLRTLCTKLGILWNPAMLHWPRGGHAADGVWAAHWYGSVHASTGFAGPEGELPRLTGEARMLVDKAMPSYLRMRALI